MITYRNPFTEKFENGCSVLDKPKPTYEGATLKAYWQTERVMSDVWDSVYHADVWDGEKVTTLWLGYEYGDNDTVTVDATPEVLAAVAAWEKAEQDRKGLEAEEKRKWLAECEAKRVTVGKTVKVVRGRKVALGTTGKVLWMGNDPYSRYNKRCLVGWGPKDAKGWFTMKAYTSDSNLEVIL